VIRRARDADWSGVQALWHEVDDLHARLAPAYFRAAVRQAEDWRALLKVADTAIFVAQAGDEGSVVPGTGVAGDGARAVSGVVSVRIYDTPPDPAMVPLRRGHVEMLVVGQAHRRRGIGAQLMRQVAMWARGQGAAELVLTVWSGNDAAAAFYDRLGYQELSRVLHTPLA
jgi:ribosomal protein S18 acetylase RimI-like enzyme